MGAGKSPGFWCRYHDPTDVDDGTMCLVPSPLPLALDGSKGRGRIAWHIPIWDDRQYELASGYPFGTPGGRIPVSQRRNPSHHGLVGINRRGHPPATGERVFQLTPATLVAFRALRAAAIVAGFDTERFTLTSAYRSAERQAELAAEGRRKHGAAEAGNWVAQGVSEHITGRTFDLDLGIQNNRENAESGAFERLSEYQWLKEHAPHFGFSPYGREPWHWSYDPVVR